MAVLAESAGLSDPKCGAFIAGVSVGKPAQKYLNNIANATFKPLEDFFLILVLLQHGRQLFNSDLLGLVIVPALNLGQIGSMLIKQSFLRFLLKSIKRRRQALLGSRLSFRPSK